MNSDAAPEALAHAECCCKHPTPALCPSILLSHDGTAFVAQLLGSTGPKGRGSSYRAALASLEKLMAIARDSANGSAPPVLGIVRRRAQSRQYVPPVKARLVERFGQLSNRELAARIGIVTRNAPNILSCAFSGQGTRFVRCAIALALGELPSELWPGRSEQLRKGDDAEFHLMKSEQAKDVQRGPG